jgi:hypothetical protein
MGALSKQEAAKKGPKKASLHTEPIHELPKAVDWDEQERIKASLKGKFIQPFRSDGKPTKTNYDPERAAELCIMRRGGMNLKNIEKEAHVTYATIKKWLSDYPEFSQEWGDAYADYVTDLAEELPKIAENLMVDLRRDGRKLSKTQFGRYLRACEFLADQVKFAASHRVPALYGDAEGGMELVLVQPTGIPDRVVTQDVARAEAWKEEKKEAEDAEVSLPDSSDPDGGERGLPGDADSDGTGRSELPPEHKKPGPKRQYKVGGRPLVKHSKQGKDEGQGPSSD